MRFFTVSDAKAARKSVFYATGFIAYFYILTFIIGFGAIPFLMNDPSYFKLGADGGYNKVTSIIGGTTWPRSISRTRPAARSCSASSRRSPSRRSSRWWPG